MTQRLIDGVEYEQTGEVWFLVSCYTLLLSLAHLNGKNIQCIVIFILLYDIRITSDIVHCTMIITLYVDIQL